MIWTFAFALTENDSFNLQFACYGKTQPNIYNGPGDSKSIKFLGVFGVDCFFSKFDAFLTKAPETAQTARFDFWVILQSMASI